MNTFSFIRTSLLLFALIVSLAQSNNGFYGDHDEYSCTHDQNEQNPGFLEVEEDSFNPGEERRLQSSTYSNIRLYPYFEPLMQSAPSSYVAYIQYQVVPAVFDYFNAALKVKYPVVGNLKVGSSVSTICEINTPSILQTTGVPADMFIYFDSYADGSSQIANSKYCYLATGSKRPLIARTTFNRNMFLDPQGNAVVHERNIYLLLHETTHNFGFSGYNYGYYLDPYGNTLTGHIKTVQIAGSTRTVLDLPPLTSRLRNYYGCSSLPGAILENNGGDSTSSSHFERKYFVFEYMSSGSVFGERISEFSLALLEGTGWYIPDYNYAEPYFIGKGEGCPFINNICSSNSASFPEYCSGSGRGCAASGRGGGNCWSDYISDNCKYVFPFQDNDCENADGTGYARLPQIETYGRGAGSKCFMGDLTTMSYGSSRTYFCFKYNCVNYGSSTQLEVILGSDKVVCNQAGSVSVDGYHGTIECPDPETFCGTIGVKFCPRNCMGRGTCVNNQCQCNSGYTGTDCAGLE